MAATLLPTSIALPGHSHSQEEIAGIISGWLAERPELAARAKSVLNNSGVERRYTVRPAEWYLAHVSVTERSEVYREEMIALCEQAAGAALAACQIDPAQVGLIVSTSCTGLMIPSVESHLMNRMAFRSDTRRMPLTQLGCAAGAAAVARADDFLRAHPESAVLILAAELPSLTAQVSDFSMANIVSAALFGDGAAATLVAGERLMLAGGSTGDRNTAAGGWAGDRHPAASAGNPGGGRQGQGGAGMPEQGPAPRIVATRSVHFPDTLHMMGFDNTDTGLKIFLSPQVPRFLRQNLPAHVRPFLEEQGLDLTDVAHFLLHPGGPKVIAGLESVFGLSRDQTRLSHEVLRQYGNLSSATVLFLAHLFEQETQPRPGDYGLMLAVGPGFCAEMVLLQW